MKPNELRGKIIAMYGSLKKFADKLGWSYRKVCYIVSGKQEPTGKDIEQMADALDVQIPEEVHVLFLT